MPYNIKQARQHQAKLVGIYRALKRQGADQDRLAWVASEVNCMDMEIEEAHKNERPAGQGESIEQQGKVILFPILS